MSKQYNKAEKRKRRWPSEAEENSIKAKAQAKVAPKTEAPA